MSLYIRNIKQIFQNLVSLYGNFIHWNISKILVFLYENIAGFILSLPFVGVIVYQYFSDYNKLGFASSIDEFMLGNIGNIIITMISFLVILVIFICTYTYGNFLMMNVYKSYLNGDRLPYRENLYFSWKHFRTYMGILGWASLYVLAPIVVCMIFIIPMGLLAKNVPGSMTILVGIVSILVVIALIGWFVSLVIRLTFSSYGLLYDPEVGKTAKWYIDESFRLTKGKVWKIVFLALPFVFVLGIVAAISQSVEQNLTENRVYTALVEVQKQSGQDDHKLLEGFFSGDEADKDDFRKIENAFEPVKNDVNKAFLSAAFKYIDTKSTDKDGGIFMVIFTLFSFFFLEGITSMLYISIYRLLTTSESEKMDLSVRS
ncbi:MAG: hypothetical protein PHH70_02135 [Candidatus Gracilibacteria bacterium]|nr:hypothetical protein [Candidatus Gracilibacteria bacterium]